jgi:hypothetical protein
MFKQQVVHLPETVLESCGLGGARRIYRMVMYREWTLAEDDAQPRSIFARDLFKLRLYFATWRTLEIRELFYREHCSSFASNMRGLSTGRCTRELSELLDRWRWTKQFGAK